MNPEWRPIEVVLDASLSAEVVEAHIEATIRVAAGDAGEFIERIRIYGSQPLSDGALRWTAAYRTGLPIFVETLIGD